MQHPYRFYDDEDELLYVGLSCSVFSMTITHRSCHD